MPWGRLDDSLYDHPKLDLIPAEERNACIGLWARAISWCNRFLTDGQVPRDRIGKLDGTMAQAELMVGAGLLDESSTGFVVHDFLHFNDSRAQIQERRQKEAERKASWRAGRRPAGSPNGTSSVDDDDVPPGVPEGVPPSVPPGRTEMSQRVSRDSSRARHGANPDPTRPDPSRPTRDPQTPSTAGGHGSRSNGTNPRAKADAAAAHAELGRKAKAWRRNQRQLAYYRGALTATELDEMNERDAPTSEIPGWAEHQAQLEAEAAAVGA